MKQIISIILLLVICVSTNASEPLYIGSYKNFTDKKQYDIILYHTENTLDSLQIAGVGAESNFNIITIKGNNIKTFHQSCVETYEQYKKHCDDRKNVNIFTYKKPLKAKWNKVQLKGVVCNEKTNYDRVELGGMVEPHAFIYSEVELKDYYVLFASIVYNENINLNVVVAIETPQEVEEFSKLLSPEFLHERIKQKYEVMKKQE